MKTEQIKLVLAIARERFISKAAEELFISQPNASNMLKKLENELGYQLFERTKAGMLPTYEGLEFIDYAGSIERSLDAISRIREPGKRVGFKVISSFRHDFAETAFEKLCEKYLTDSFAVNFSYCVVNNTDSVKRMVEDGSGDVAVVSCRKKLFEFNIHNAAQKRLETALIGEMHLELICSKGHPMIRERHVSSDLLGCYPCFTGLHTSNSDLFAPYFLTKNGVDIHSSIAMDPGPATYRLLQKTKGYLISPPVSDEIKAAYDLDSQIIDDSAITVYAIYREDPPNDTLIGEYITNCRAMI